MQQGTECKSIIPAAAEISDVNALSNITCTIYVISPISKSRKLSVIKITTSPQICCRTTLQK